MYEDLLDRKKLQVDKTSDLVDYLLYFTVLVKKVKG